MPKIPTYDSQARIGVERPQSGGLSVSGKVQAQAPAVTVSPSAFGIESQAMGQFGEAIAKVGETLYKLQAESEFYKASTASAQGRKTIEATEDNNPQGWLERRDEELLKLKETVLKDMKNPQAKRQFQLEYDRDLIDTQFRLKSRYTGITSMDALNSFYTNRAEIENTIYNATSETEKEKEINRVKNQYKGLVLSGLMEGKPAANEFKVWKNGLVEGKVKSDIAKNPAIVSRELQKGELGAYKGLSQEKRLDLIKQAGQYEEKLKNQEEERIAFATNKAEADQIDLKFKNILTEKMVENDPDTTPEFKKAMIANLRSPKKFKPTALDGIIKFNELVERNKAIAKKESAWLGMGKAPFDEVTKFRADTINANAKEFITDKQMQDLLSETSKTFYRDPIFQNTLDQLAAQSSLYDTSEAQARVKADMYGNLIQKVIAGKTPQEAVTEVIKERINKELGEAIKVDEFGFIIGDTRQGYKYIGNNQWQKI